MSEREQDNLEAEVIDPPSSEGGNEAVLSRTEVKPLDPPEGSGSGGGGVITPIKDQ